MSRPITASTLRYLALIWSMVDARWVEHAALGFRTGCVKHRRLAWNHDAAMPAL